MGVFAPVIGQIPHYKRVIAHKLREITHISGVKPQYIGIFAPVNGQIALYLGLNPSNLRVEREI